MIIKSKDLSLDLNVFKEINEFNGESFSSDDEDIYIGLKFLKELLESEEFNLTKLEEANELKISIYKDLFKECITKDKLDNIGPILNLLFNLNWNFDMNDGKMEELLSNIVLELPLHFDKLFYPSFNENSLDRWIVILKYFMNSDHSKFIYRKRGNLFCTIIRRLKFWDILVEKKLFENVPYKITAGLWASELMYEIVDEKDIKELERLRDSVGDFKSEFTFGGVSDSAAIWLKENYKEEYDNYLLELKMDEEIFKGVTVKPLTDPSILEQLPPIENNK